MAYSIIVQQQVRVTTGTPPITSWQPAGDILLTKGSFSASWETDGKAAIETSSGTVFFIDKSLSQIETWLNT